MLRRLLLVFLLLLVAAVVVVDRVGAHVAAHVLAGQLEDDEHLQERPDVRIGGIPFLTQVIGGKYGDVSVTAHDFKTPDGVTVTTLKAHLHGAHIPFSKVVNGSVSKVPIDHVDGTAFLSFAAVSQYLSRQGTSVTASRSSSSAINLAGPGVVVLGHPKLRSLVVSVEVVHSVVTLSGSTRIRGVSSGLVLSIPLRSLPFRFSVTSVTVGANGITGTGTANHVTLGS